MSPQQISPLLRLVEEEYCAEIDVLRTTATQLKRFLDDGLITSHGLVQVYLRQIKRHNTRGLKLRALIDIAPEEDLLSYAQLLDSERAAGKLRGEYHGIPIVVKDTINTCPSLGMRTTLGSFAMLSSKTARNAAVVDALLRNGIIILAKANLSEFGTNKCKGISPSGLSPVGGQTQPAYVEGGVVPGDKSLGHSTPGGSSSGSAVAVAAGFAPWSIGAETDGSLQTPANRASLYALKPTIGAVSGDGVFRLTRAFDSLGGMAKSAEDLAVLTEILLETGPSSPLRGKSMKSGFRTDLQGLTLGFVDVDEWTLPASLLKPDEDYLEQRRAQWKHAMDEFQRLGATIVSPIRPKKASEYTFDGQGSYHLIRYGGWKPLVADYLRDLAESKVRSLDDIVQFGIDHPDLEFSDACPNQDSLVTALNYNTPVSVVEAAIVDVRRAAGPDGIDKIMAEHGLDAIMAPTESQICTIAAFSGYPIGTMPLGYLQSSGRPHGISILSTSYKEVLILSIMDVYEKNSFVRLAPGPLDGPLTSERSHL